MKIRHKCVKILVCFWKINLLMENINWKINLFFEKSIY